VAGLETGAADQAESRGWNQGIGYTLGQRRILENQLSSASGLSKVRMIQQIKGFNAKFMAKPLGDFRPLDDGEIHIGKARPNDHVASKVSEMQTARGGEGKSCSGATGCIRSFGWIAKRGSKP